MTNGQLFIRENPTVEIKINGSCVWIYFDGVNHYTMPVEWWEQEIEVLDNIRAEILTLDDVEYDFDGYCKAIADALQIIDKYKIERNGKE